MLIKYTFCGYKVRFMIKTGRFRVSIAYSAYPLFHRVSLTYDEQPHI